MPKVLVTVPHFINDQVSSKLDNRNYTEWRSEIINILSDQNLEECLHTWLSPPVSFLSACTRDSNLDGMSIYLSNYVQDQVLVGWLRSNMEESILQQVMHCETSAVLWTYLDELFSKYPLSRIAELQDRLDNVQQGSESCSEYFDKMKSMADELESLGATVTEEDLICQIVSKVRPEFSSFAEVLLFSQEPLPSLTAFRDLFLANEAAHPSSRKYHHASTNNSGPRPPQHTSQLSLVPTLSFAPPAQPPQQVTRPTFTSASPPYTGKYQLHVGNKKMFTSPSAWSRISRTS
jgi:gag-polypeptide of LTR copia-type